MTLPVGILHRRSIRPRALAIVAALVVVGSSCGSGDDTSAVTLDSVETPVLDDADPIDGVSADDALVDGAQIDEELTDAGITTSAVADESADRSELPPRKGVTTRSPDAVGDGNPPQNVGTAIVRITDAEGNVCEVCMWHADEAAERSTGLMGVFDLDLPIGMAFAWDAPTSGNFFMLNTPTPLSIAWFAADGSYLSEADMEPCITADSSTCERYGTTGDYILAIEMFQGELGKVGIGPGSRAEIVKLPEPGVEDICPLLD